MPIARIGSGRRYVPILKAKRGEMTALRHVRTSGRCCPLLQLIPDGPTPRRITAIAQAWPTSNPIFLDATYMADVNVTNSWITALESKIYYIPTINPSSPSQIAARMIQDILQKNRGFCVRLMLNDAAVVHACEQILGNICTATNTPAGQADVILDLSEIRGDAHLYAPAVQNIISRIAAIGPWNSITMAGASFPSILPPDCVQSFIAIPRVEWEIWRLVEPTVSCALDYGDYTTQSAVLMDLSGIDGSNIASKLRYATNDAWLVAKGRGGVGSDYHGLARQLVSRPEFCGATFSYGDNFIAECAASASRSAGNHETKVTVDVNHHIEFVLSQL